MGNCEHECETCRDDEVALLDRYEALADFINSVGFEHVAKLYVDEADPTWTDVSQAYFGTDEAPFVVRQNAEGRWVVGDV